MMLGYPDYGKDLNELNAKIDHALTELERLYVENLIAKVKETCFYAFLLGALSVLLAQAIF